MNLITCRDRRWEYRTRRYGVRRDSSTLSDCALLRTSRLHWSEQESPMVGGEWLRSMLTNQRKPLVHINAVTWLSYQHSYKQIGYTVGVGGRENNAGGAPSVGLLSAALV
jgi:hypothetical protein